MSDKNLTSEFGALALEIVAGRVPVTDLLEPLLFILQKDPASIDDTFATVLANIALTARNQKVQEATDSIIELIAEKCSPVIVRTILKLAEDASKNENSFYSDRATSIVNRLSKNKGVGEKSSNTLQGLTKSPGCVNALFPTFGLH